MDYKELRTSLILMLLGVVGIMTLVGGLEFIINGAGNWLWRFLIIYVPAVLLLYKLKDLYNKEKE